MTARHPSVEGVKEEVLCAPAYTLRAYYADVKLNQNENPYDFPLDLKEEVIRRYKVRSWSRYPDFVPEKLQEQLADFAGWRKDGVLVGNGSNELLLATLMVLVRDRTPVVLPSPTFTVYGLVSQILGADIVQVPLNDDMRYDAARLVERANSTGARILIACSPNNPTGSELDAVQLESILDGFQGHVLIDEAYFEFSGKTALHYLESHPRLIITRTFSKAMGMAGLRVGYLMAHPELAVQIAKAKLPYNINQFSLCAAEVALQNLDRFQPAIQSILSERERLGRELARFPGVRVYPTGANFFLFQVPAAPRRVFDELYQQGVLIRDVSGYPMLSKCLRVTVGSPRENDRFLSSLKTCLEITAADDSAPL